MRTYGKFQGMVDDYLKRHNLPKDHVRKAGANLVGEVGAWDKKDDPEFKKDVIKEDLGK